jgi:hypothetical protein
MRFSGGKWEKKNRGSDKGHRFNGLMFQVEVIGNGKSRSSRFAEG